VKTGAFLLGNGEEAIPDSWESGNANGLFFLKEETILLNFSPSSTIHIAGQKGTSRYIVTAPAFQAIFHENLW
jgi:hypothetical protein